MTESVIARRTDRPVKRLRACFKSGSADAFWVSGAVNFLAGLVNL
jgi:hypothetical protein